jgi:hypothetical protein
MSRNSDTTNVSRREFLAAAGTIAATNSFAVRKITNPDPNSPPPPASYVVTIDATTTPISYRFPDSTGVAHNANRMKVNASDKVAWIAKTPSPNHHAVTLFFLKETPLVDATANNKPIYALYWTESQESPSGIGGTIDPDGSGTYECYVAVVDTKTNQIYIDDPKMIVGSGNFELMVELSQEVKKLGPVANECPSQSKDIRRIQENLQGIISKLE